jgi:hypothetical protein
VAWLEGEVRWSSSHHSKWLMLPHPWRNLITFYQYLHALCILVVVTIYNVNILIALYRQYVWFSTVLSYDCQLFVVLVEVSFNSVSEIRQLHKMQDAPLPSVYVCQAVLVWNGLLWGMFMWRREKASQTEEINRCPIVLKYPFSFGTRLGGEELVAYFLTFTKG